MNINLLLNLIDFVGFALACFAAMMTAEFMLSCIKRHFGHSKELSMLPRMTEKLPTRLILSFIAALIICLCGGGTMALLITGLILGLLLGILI